MKDLGNNALFDPVIEDKTSASKDPSTLEGLDKKPQNYMKGISKYARSYSHRAPQKANVRDDETETVLYTTA